MIGHLKNLTVDIGIMAKEGLYSQTIVVFIPIHAKHKGRLSPRSQKGLHPHYIDTMVHQVGQWYLVIEIENSKWVGRSISDWQIRIRCIVIRGCCKERRCKWINRHIHKLGLDTIVLRHTIVADTERYLLPTTIGSLRMNAVSEKFGDRVLLHHQY